MKQKEKMQIHILPLEDPAIQHTISKRCKCKPATTKHDNGVATVAHQMVGAGPDKWSLEVVTK
jgi:hypothetical protein